LRRAPGQAATAAAIAERHASRADGTRRFVNDRAARPARPACSDSRQMSFDL
jgi:hypothetical protein